MGVDGRPPKGYLMEPLDRTVAAEIAATISQAGYPAKVLDDGEFGTVVRASVGETMAATAFVASDGFIAIRFRDKVRDVKTTEKTCSPSDAATRMVEFMAPTAPVKRFTREQCAAIEAAEAAPYVPSKRMVEIREKYRGQVIVEPGVTFLTSDEAADLNAHLARPAAPKPRPPRRRLAGTVVRK